MTSALFSFGSRVVYQLSRKSLNYQSVRLLSAELDGQFDSAKEKLNTLQDEQDNDVKLQIYALFKQANLGENTTKKPGAFNFVGQAKWTAWSQLGAMSKDEAKTKYIALVDKLSSK